LGSSFGGVCALAAKGIDAAARMAMTLSVSNVFFIAIILHSMPGTTTRWPELSSKS
jgi:hypothetical protein